MNQDSKPHKKQDENQGAMSLSECTLQSLQQYFQDLGEETPSQLYNFVIREVEGPMLQVVMDYTNHNQSQAAAILGLNRGTLRKKLKEYNLI